MDVKLLEIALTNPNLFRAIHETYPPELIHAEIKFLSARDRLTYNQLRLDIKGDRITTNHPRVIGDRVYVAGGGFRIKGVGVVVSDHGYGSFRVLEVKMQVDGQTFNQVVCADYVRLLIPFN